MTIVLALVTFAVRFFGVFAGQRLPQRGPWAKGLNALPGCLIVALVTVLLVDGAADEWIGALIALAVAVVTRSLPLTMVAGILKRVGAASLRVNVISPAGC